MGKRKIVNDGQDRSENHRSDFETCPDCGHSMPWREWNETATTLILNPYCSKSGHVAVMSECPKCFEPSWVHVAMGGWEYRFEQWPNKWVEVVDELENAVKLQAVRDCAFSLCGKCVKLTSMTVKHSAYRHCEIGMGPVRSECELFVEISQPLRSPRK